MSGSAELVVGNVAVLEAAFALDGEPADPVTVTLSLKSPSGNIVEPDVERVGEGSYRYDLLLDEPGVWLWLWVGTGAAAAAVQGVIVAIPQLVAS